MRSLFFAALLFSAALAADPVSPDKWTATFTTDVPNQPPIVIAMTRELAPLGSDRLHAAIWAGFYNNSAFFRVVPDFVLQFGISGSAAENKEWLHKSIKDDPVKGSNTKGTLTFATAGPNTRTTQLFINYKDNKNLDAQGFAPFGTVTSGMATAVTVNNPTPGLSGGIDQGEYEAKGNDWVKKTYPKTNFIVTATVATGH